MVDDSFLKNTSHSYDLVAADYAQKFQNELDAKPFDRKMLELLVEKAGKQGVFCDMGCGPGQIAAYLDQLGVQAFGVDLSAQMILEAQKSHPHVAFQKGNMLHLNGIEADIFHGIAAFYSIIHIPRPQVVQALRELARVLRPDGRLLLTFHVGDETRHLDTWFDKPVALDFAFFEVAEMIDKLQTAGLVVEECIERNAYPDEVQTRRAYLFARKVHHP